MAAAVSSIRNDACSGITTEQASQFSCSLSKGGGLGISSSPGAVAPCREPCQAGDEEEVLELSQKIISEKEIYPIRSALPKGNSCGLRSAGGEFVISNRARQIGNQS